MLYSPIAVSPSFIPKIEQAYADIERRIEPVSRERAEQIAGRLILHFPSDFAEPYDSRRQRYAEALSHYPEDLVCAAYQHVLHQREAAVLPSIGELLGIIVPEMQRRLSLYEKLGILLSQLRQEQAA